MLRAEAHFYPCILPRANGGGGPRSCAVEGARSATILLQRQRSVELDAPSTTLRVVPLPRFAGADKAIPFSRCFFASEFCLHAARKPFPKPPSQKGGRRSAKRRIRPLAASGEQALPPVHPSRGARPAGRARLSALHRGSRQRLSALLAQLQAMLPGTWRSV
jgi:hypothetical protein